MRDRNQLTCHFNFNSLNHSHPLDKEGHSLKEKRHTNATNNNFLFTNIKILERFFKHFRINAALYSFTLFALTYSAIVASTTADPTVYDGPLQYSRSVFEVIGFGIAGVITVCLEFNQMRKLVDLCCIEYTFGPPFKI